MSGKVTLQQRLRRELLCILKEGMGLSQKVPVPETA